MRSDGSDGSLEHARTILHATRPTAVNLRWALDRMVRALAVVPPAERTRVAYETAARICDEDVEACHSIGLHGAPLLGAVYEHVERRRPVRVLTHCNAGWLATVDWGTALAPVYVAHDAGVPVHVWVDETRPRNQGMLTAWELGHHGVPHTVVADNAGGHLMQHGLVDLVITGTDRTTADGDVCNKIGTYLKALAARDNDVPFYVACPGSTIDFNVHDGVREIPIEERDESELTHMTGVAESGVVLTVRIAPPGARAKNHAFDVTPARLVAGIITERGLCTASREGLRSLYPA
jgi:methylthioribose-1-phosphate isomerase